jgi:hypothetical protein
MTCKNNSYMMEKKITACILTLFCLFNFSGLRGQNTKLLDEKNGFQNFKFNTPLSNYTQYNPRKVRESHYVLQNIKDIKIGDFDLEKIELFFLDDNLIKIMISLDDQSRQKNEIIYNGLVKNYGKYTSKRSTSGFKYVSEMIWEGEHVHLIYALSTFREGEEVKTKITLTYYRTFNISSIDVSPDL